MANICCREEDIMEDHYLVITIFSTCSEMQNLKNQSLALIILLELNDLTGKRVLQITLFSSLTTVIYVFTQKKTVFHISERSFGKYSHYAEQGPRYLPPKSTLELCYVYLTAIQQVRALKQYITVYEQYPNSSKMFWENYTK